MFPDPYLGLLYDRTQWYVASTQPRHEKQAAKQLTSRGVETFLPLYPSRRQWKDRKIEVSLPLFPGYVFVRMAYRERLRALQVPSVLQFVTFGGLPAPVADDELETLRSGLAADGSAEPFPYLAVGQRVKVKTGPFAGLVGILSKKKSRTRLVVSIEHIQRSVIIDLDGAEVEPAPLPTRSTQ